MTNTFLLDVLDFGVMAVRLVSVVSQLPLYKKMLKNINDGGRVKQGVKLVG